MKKAWQKAWKPTLVLLLLLGVWELTCRVFEIPPWLLPSPAKVVDEAITGYALYTPHIASSIQLAITSYLIGITVGLIVAILLFRVPLLHQAFYPLLIISQNIPTIVLAPLLIVWLGFGMLPKIIVITLVCFFPVTIATLDGFRQTDRDLLHYMKMIGASNKQIFWKLQWPHALPSIFSGLKIAGTYSVMGAVITEWLGSNKGIGVYMTLASSSFRIDRVFVAIIIIILLSLSFFSLILLVEKRVLRWQQRGGQTHE